MIGKDKTKFNLTFNKDYWVPILRAPTIEYMGPPKRLDNGDYVYDIKIKY